MKNKSIRKFLKPVITTGLIIGNYLLQGFIASSILKSINRMPKELEEIYLDFVVAIVTVIVTFMFFKEYLKDLDEKPVLINKKFVFFILELCFFNMLLWIFIILFNDSFRPF
jgi:hypothetical protein